MRERGEGQAGLRCCPKGRKPRETVDCFILSQQRREDGDGQGERALPHTQPLVLANIGVIKASNRKISWMFLSFHKGEERIFFLKFHFARSIETVGLSDRVRSVSQSISLLKARLCVQLSSYLSHDST